MKNKKVVAGLILILAIFLTACGSGASGGKVETGVNEISYKDLMKKIEDRESFFLLTIASDEKILEESKYLEYYDKTLKYYDIPAFFVNLKGESEDTIKDLSNNYFHPLYKENSGEPSWEAEGDGLVYVENGGVMNWIIASPYHEKYLKDGKFTESDAEENVFDLLNALDKREIEYTTE